MNSRFTNCKFIAKSESDTAPPTVVRLTSATPTSVASIGAATVSATLASPTPSCPAPTRAALATTPLNYSTKKFFPL
jgi:hypothetical protein